MLRFFLEHALPRPEKYVTWTKQTPTSAGRFGAWFAVQEIRPKTRPANMKDAICAYRFIIASVCRRRPRRLTRAEEYSYPDYAFTVSFPSEPSRNHDLSNRRWPLWRRAVYSVTPDVSGFGMTASNRPNAAPGESAWVIAMRSTRWRKGEIKPRHSPPPSVGVRPTAEHTGVRTGHHSSIANLVLSQVSALSYLGRGQALRPATRPPTPSGSSNPGFSPTRIDRSLERSQGLLEPNPFAWRRGGAASREMPR